MQHIEDKINMTKYQISRLMKSSFLVLTIILLSEFAFGAAGVFCDTVSPCICGLACNAGNEAANGYNTIDACQDGDDFTYEFVNDINVTDMNSSTFYGSDTITINAHVDCDLDGDGVTISYNNGTDSGGEWVVVHNEQCQIDGQKYISATWKLDNVAGNHSVRAVIVYMGSSNLICGFDHDDAYSDTDDVTFRVIPQNFDLSPPAVTDVSPSPGTVYFSSGNYTVNITANVTDNIDVESVLANVTWSTYSQLIVLSGINGGIYSGLFTNTSGITLYNITYIAGDTSDNRNMTTKTNFYINATTNITVVYPEEGVTYPRNESYVEYEFGSGPEINETWIRINGESMVIGNNQYVGAAESGGTAVSESDYLHSNLTQSFMFERDTYLDKVSVKLKKNGTGTSLARLEIRNSTPEGFASDTVMFSYAEINSTEIGSNFEWINLTMNQTVLFSADTLYWLYLSPNGSSQDHYSWEATSENPYVHGN
ncbi:MAG: hypothetical protein KKF44_00855, partial [Nanoarchaeota archaeon]|nr:hypothetical protein [Nanoarchaeota archaeon]